MRRRPPAVPPRADSCLGPSAAFWMPRLRGVPRSCALQWPRAPPCRAPPCRPALRARRPGRARRAGHTFKAAFSPCRACRNTVWLRMECQLEARAMGKAFMGIKKSARRVLDTIDPDTRAHLPCSFERMGRDANRIANAAAVRQIGARRAWIAGRQRTTWRPRSPWASGCLSRRAGAESKRPSRPPSRCYAPAQTRRRFFRCGPSRAPPCTRSGASGTPARCRGAAALGAGSAPTGAKAGARWTFSKDPRECMPDGGGAADPDRNAAGLTPTRGFRPRSLPGRAQCGPPESVHFGAWRGTAGAPAAREPGDARGLAPFQAGRLGAPW